MDDLPDNFDVIVYGTGIPESILASASARVDKQVLHIDQNSYYGGLWASFNFENLNKWIIEHKDSSGLPPKQDLNPELLLEGEKSVPLMSQHQFVDNFDVFSCSESSIESLLSSNKLKVYPSLSTTDSSTEEKPVECPIKVLLSQSRKFNIDLSPKVLYSKGKFVDLLISSNTTRYAEFKPLTRVFTLYNDVLEQVPVSRADVFCTKSISVVQKHHLMKFLKSCWDYKSDPAFYEGFETKPFKSFLKSKKLPNNIEHYLYYSIAMVEDTTSTIDALESIQMFIHSLGRFGNSPFIWPIYGNGELSQGFCRLCAVFGGIYYLKRTIDHLILDINGKCTAIISEGKRINCKWFVCDSSYISKHILEMNVESLPRLSRAIFITDFSILPSSSEEITLLRVPPSDNIPNSVSVLELGSGSMVCPKDYFIVYMTTRSSGATAKDDLEAVAQKLFRVSKEEESPKPCVLWSVYFNQIDTSSLDLTKKVSAGIMLTPTPNIDPDYGKIIDQAKMSFVQMYPNEEYLPRAPEPEDIILETSDPADDNVEIPQMDADANQGNSVDSGAANANQGDWIPVENPNVDAENPEPLPLFIQVKPREEDALQADESRMEMGDGPLNK